LPVFDYLYRTVAPEDLVRRTVHESPRSLPPRIDRNA
jgi:hypothetical protein